MLYSCIVTFSPDPCGSETTNVYLALWFFLSCSFVLLTLLGFGNDSIANRVLTYEPRFSDLVMVTKIEDGTVSSRVDPTRVCFDNCFVEGSWFNDLLWLLRLILLRQSGSEDLNLLRSTYPYLLNPTSAASSTTPG